METTIIVAIIGSISSVIVGVLSLIGVITTNKASNKKIEQTLTTAQALTDLKIEELTREVRLHNNFVTRVPILEEKVSNLEKKIGA